MSCILDEYEPYNSIIRTRRYRMSNIVSENGLIVGSVEHLNLLYVLSQDRTERLGINFNLADYKWVLGMNVIRDIEYNNHYIVSGQDCPRTLFGIVIEIDYHNPDNVQLWENITNKL